jgi:hypothetical protein
LEFDNVAQIQMFFRRIHSPAQDREKECDERGKRGNSCEDLPEEACQ